MLIETKLQLPVLRANLIKRTALLRQLDEALSGKLTLVSAPAGFGKSTLLGQWLETLRDRGAATGWLSLDAQDNDLSRFLEYLVAAINRADPAIASDIPALLRSSPILPVDSILTALVNDLSAKAQQLFLVLDDCHHLTSPEIVHFLDALLTYAPAAFHLILATRGQIPLKVANMRVRGQMLRLDDSHLRFSLEETESFLNSARGLGLDPADVIFLQHRTEGWIAGLQLASLSLGQHQGREEFIKRFSGTDRDIADFLIHDVIDRLSAEVIDFLLKTSILGRISAPLADAVTEGHNGARLLGEIEAANLFLIPLDRERTWFRYHHLFAELLQSLLHTRHPDSESVLHFRAAVWQSQHGLTMDAVHHALAAGNSDLAASLVEDCAMPLIMQSHIVRVREWLNSLPAEVIELQPRLQLIKVWILLHMSGTRPPATVLRSIRNAYHDLERRPISEMEKQALRAEFYTLAAGVISAADRSATAARLASRWLANFPENQHFSRGTLANVLGFSCYSIGDLEEARIACAKARDSHEIAQSVIGVIYSDLIRGLTEESAGDLKRAYEYFTRAAQHARNEVGAGSYAEAVVGIFEVNILYEWNDLAAAERLLQLHRQIIEECGLVVHEITCKLHAARLAAACNRYDEALTVLERAERQGLQTRYQRLFASAIHERVRLLLLRGDLQAAKLVLMTRGIDEIWIASNRAPLPASEPVHMAFARLLIAGRRPEAALRILDDLAEPMRKGGRMRRFAQVRALSAMASYQAGDALAALAAIVDAISLCAPQGALRSLIDEGEPLQDVIAFGRERIPSWKGNSDLGQFVDKLISGRAEQAQNGERRNRPAGRTPQFSPREADVARLLSCGQSNREMARALSMAPDTVKWHLKNIFGKLGVSNRTQAVLRLQGLGFAGHGESPTPFLH